MGEFEGLEVWRGRVNPWEVDSMGHLNVRYYGGRLMEGLVGLAGAMGMPDAYKRSALTVLHVGEQHLRFLKEARSDVPLHMTAGVVELRETDATLLFQLIHSISGEQAATFLITAGPSDAASGSGQPWSEGVRRASGALMVTVPERARPRSVTSAHVAATNADLRAADRMGLRTISVGAFGPSDCDVHGRMRPDQVIARISDGMSHMFSSLGGRGGEGPLLNNQLGMTRRMGGAVLEYRVKHWETPVAGDRFVIRSGVAGVEERFQRLVHWMLDPETGRPWATAEAISISLDLEARKIMAYTPEHRARLESNVTAGLSL